MSEENYTDTNEPLSYKVPPLQDTGEAQPVPVEDFGDLIAVEKAAAFRRGLQDYLLPYLAEPEDTLNRDNVLAEYMMDCLIAHDSLSDALIEVMAAEAIKE